MSNKPFLYAPDKIHNLFAKTFGFGVPKKLDDLSFILECTPGIRLPPGYSSSEYIASMVEAGRLVSYPESLPMDKRNFVVLDLYNAQRRMRYGRRRR